MTSLDSHKPFRFPLDMEGKEGSKSWGFCDLSQTTLVINSRHWELESSYSGIQSVWGFLFV